VLVICEKSKVFFHKSLGLSGGLLRSLRFFLEKNELQIYFQKFRGSFVKSVTAGLLGDQSRAFLENCG
jgi:hypothetical protein